MGNATPEAEQGLNIGRLISLMALDTDKVSGMTVNRYCASGLETIAIASSKIRSGMADVIIAGGAESMSLIPMGGWRIVPNSDVAYVHPDWVLGHGAYSRSCCYKRIQCVTPRSGRLFIAFAFQCHSSYKKAGKFKNEIAPVTVKENYVDEEGNKKNQGNM